MREILLEEIDSTNSYAKLNIDNLEDKTVIHALKQTSGRGRLNRTWVDLGIGNLFLSLVLKPSEQFSEVYTNLTQYLSVCLCKVLESYGIESQIKWPNDVLINGKKIAGILSESVIQGGNFKGIILGVGVNLNAKQSEINLIPDKIATSLNIETGNDIDINSFREKLLDEFFSNYDKFLSEGFEMIKHDYISRNCFIGKELNIKVFDRIESGLAQSVNDRGELILEKEDRDLTLTIGDIL
ncbi:biotin--[bacterium]|nr:biotin--[acetyl-CoA-carboxylase] ligase [bacterium]